MYNNNDDDEFYEYYDTDGEVCFIDLKSNKHANEYTDETVSNEYTTAHTDIYDDAEYSRLVDDTYLGDSYGDIKIDSRTDSEHHLTTGTFSIDANRDEKKADK